MKTALSRRRFLRNSVLTGAVAPFILPSRIWAAEVQPNERITLGFIGVGTQGRGLLGGHLRSKDTRVLA